MDVRKRFLCSLLLILIATAVPIVSAAQGLRVIEAATRIHPLAQGLQVSLAIENSGPQTSAHISLELLLPDDRVRTADSRNLMLATGVSTAVFNLDLSPLAKDPDEEINLQLDRLRYLITPESATAAPSTRVEGILAVPNVMPDLFQVNAVTQRSALPGSRYSIRVRTTHPINLRAISGVSITALLGADLNDESAKPLSASATTDARGYAQLVFQLPAKFEDNELKLRITARRGFLRDEAEQDVSITRGARILLSTDKPLYEPGQTVHIRALAFDITKKAIAGAALEFRVLDPDKTLVFRSGLETSRYGIAGADWQVPASQRLGDYQIHAEFGGDTSEEGESAATVKISRYELPNFTVTVKPDRTFYLPSQNANVEVHADYLFGKPVPRGRVRVVRQTDREWNYKEQKWDITEEAPLEGETGDDGRFLAHLDFKDEFSSLADDQNSRFKDLSLAAYVTDLTTGRTEQRRFDLRLTKDPIHVYVIERYNRMVKGLPLEFFVSTSYADGGTAQCNLEIYIPSEQIKKDGEIVSSTPERPLGTARTNRYGVARVSLPTFSEDIERGSRLGVRARDRKGAQGRSSDYFSLNDSRFVHVDPDKTIYRAGEPIAVKLSGSTPGMSFVVEVLRRGQVLASQTARLAKNSTRLSFASDERFTGEVSVLAYSTEHSFSGRYPEKFLEARNVLFPANEKLGLKVAVGHATYRPGADASAMLDLSGPDGAPVKGALGLVVFDKAVEERARDGGDPDANTGFYAFRALQDAQQLGGATLRDLENLDLSKPIPDGLDLVAQVLLENFSESSNLTHMGGETPNLSTEFATLIDPAIKPVEDVLNSRYKARAEYPKNDEELRAVLDGAGIRFDELRDPWGMPYQSAYSFERGNQLLAITSAGPDKKFGTDDDFSVARLSWLYFRPQAEAIQRAVNDYHARTGGFIRDAETLKAELFLQGLNFDSLLDPWGHAYRFAFSVNQDKFGIEVGSAGPDDFTIAQTWIHYFADWEKQIDAALVRYFQSTAKFPASETELIAALRDAGIDRNTLRDPWGHPYYSQFMTQGRYGDRLILGDYQDYLGHQQKRTTVTPVTQHIQTIVLRSAGPDGKENTYDDFEVANFSAIVAEQSSREPAPARPTAAAVLSGNRGGIAGTVVDASGAVIPSTRVTARQGSTNIAFEAWTDDSGRFLLSDLPEGSYLVRFEHIGFRDYAFTSVPVRSSSITTLNVQLQVGALTQTITVTAPGPGLSATSTACEVVSVRADAKVGSTKPGLSPTAKAAMLATPRLREYFPETLLWQPELITDAGGHARVTFRLADNITTWKLEVIASTKEGEIATAEKEIRAFQPFFAEHDPPKFLTEGDEISLPAVLRNYLDRAQAIDVTMDPQSWFHLLGPGKHRAEAAAGSTARAIFPFRAVAKVKDGKQRVTAIGTDASDAIEKKVTVRPDGEERVETSSQLFTEGTTLEARFPSEMLPGSASAELKIYPNLMAHVLESIEAILERPYGCGEQTISSTYPSVLLLRAAKDAGNKSPLIARAQHYAQLGYQRLLNYRAPGGGFSYWGHGEAPDLALTAYALRFLHDASEFVAVDAVVILETRTWLLKQAAPDGSWPVETSAWKDHQRQTAILTAYVARAIAETNLAAPGATTTPPVVPQLTEALHRALAYLKPRTDEIDEPYLLASYVLAAVDVGDTAAAQPALAKLRSLAREERDASYWSLETNTPFYGWGHAGRLETTALVVEALERDTSEAGTALVSRGLLFLLRNQDRYGIWYSSQATINVIHAMVALLPARGASSNAGSESGTSPNGEADIFVNGKRAASVALPPSNELAAPVLLDLSPYLSPGSSHVEIRRAAGAKPATAQLVASYYVPWHAGAAAISDAKNRRPSASSLLTLAVSFDKTEATVGGEIRCTVQAERIGFSGYGMMLAEIGLPPGADVDRASLEHSMKESSVGMMQYDVLPDRIVVYLWPRAGGTKFSFTFRPRFGLSAKSAPSLLYDYYNPEAHAIVQPVAFIVR